MPSAAWRSLLGFCVGTASLLAGEYAKISPGVNVELGYTTGNTTVPFQSASGNIQGGTTQWTYGLGLSAPVRLGETLSWSLCSLVAIPTLSARVGHNSDDQVSPNLNFYSPDGSLTVIQNASSHRSTQTREIALSLPIRWYVGGSAAYGGFYLEAGPVVVRAQQNVDFTVTGLSLAQTTTLSESTTIRQTDAGVVVGLGVTNIYRGYQFTYGLSVRSMTSKDPIAANQIAAVFSWTF